MSIVLIMTASDSDRCVPSFNEHNALLIPENSDYIIHTQAIPKRLFFF